MSNPKFLNIPPKEQVNFRIDKSLHDKLMNYVNLRGINKTDAINEILKDFLENKILTNDYLNQAGLYFKIPLDMTTKNKFIHDKQVLNSNNNNILSKNIPIKINQIPNNLDVSTKEGYKSNKDNTLHRGIDFTLIIESLELWEIMETLEYGKLEEININVLDCLYCFCFEVLNNNKTEVYLIDSYDAINELSIVNNKQVGDSLINVVEQLEEIQNKTVHDLEIAFMNNYTEDIEQFLNTIHDELTELIKEIGNNITTSNILNKTSLPYFL